MSQYQYLGSELEVFSFARNWKRYYRAVIRRFLGPTVLEVGAGIGATTRALCSSMPERWLCLEPDESLAGQIRTSIQNGELPASCEVRVGTLSVLGQGERFHTILYIDVLEHIDDDRAELSLAAAHLHDGGYLIVLAPAYPSLYSKFDEHVGHYRRYTKNSLLSIAPPALFLVTIVYLDSIGALASAANRFVLSASLPTKNQILLWDRLMIPISRVTDRLVAHRLGKSIVAIWRKVPVVPKE